MSNLLVILKDELQLDLWLLWLRDALPLDLCELHVQHVARTRIVAPFHELSEHLNIFSGFTRLSLKSNFQTGNLLKFKNIEIAWRRLQSLTEKVNILVNETKLRGKSPTCKCWVSRCSTCYCCHPRTSCTWRARSTATIRNSQQKLHHPSQ